MLPPRHRLRRSADFAAVLRIGRRRAASTVVVHLLLPEDVRAGGDGPIRAPGGPGAVRDGGPQGPVGEPSRIGLVVSKAVGNSVVRHRVSRRLRGVLAVELARLPVGSDLVVRALPAAATAPSSLLGADISRAVSHLGDRHRVDGRGRRDRHRSAT